MITGGAASSPAMSPRKESQHEQSLSLSLKLQLGSLSAFDLEKAVCSHGLFMMAPNRWDPISKTFHRPLRLSSCSAVSLPVSVSHAAHSEQIEIRVSGTDSLSAKDQQAILDQVSRMLRISENNDRVVKEFHQLHEGGKQKGFGRIFRSPTLFEDMVKCILLCNCTWPRTLSMAKALCSLQINTLSQDFKPKTPKKMEKKRKHSEPKNKKISIKLETKFTEQSTEETPINSPLNENELNNSDQIKIGDFPTPAELAGLDATYLAAQCKLGYRAQRIVSLARSIVNGEIDIKRLEQSCNDGFVFDKYDDLYSELLSISGFGPFTCSNVLMCMGFFHKIPADTETIRHLKLFHKRTCTTKDVNKEIDAIYGKFAPFQFLAYWYEMWEYYEETFGKTGDMGPCDYDLITATNMKTEKNGSKKRKV